MALRDLYYVSDGDGSGETIRERSENAAAFIFDNDSGLDTLEVCGDVDLANIEEFKAALFAAAEGTKALLVDLTKCTYIDSSGLSALIHCAKHVIAGLTVRVRSGGFIERVLEITSLRAVFSVETV